MEYIWHKESEFQKLNPITQVYGVCFNEDGNILILRELGKGWNIPGGKPEQNENSFQALKRELEEEVNVTVNEIEMIGYFEVCSEETIVYQLRFACSIDTINNQTIDPANGLINERKFVSPGEFFDYVKIEDYHSMLEEALNWYRQKQSTSRY